MCTVLLRFAPGTAWPVLVGAVRDEFASRSWDPPGEHWPALGPLLGGRDRFAGGTWLAVDPYAPAVAALLNGAALGPPADGLRPTRGRLPLDALTGAPLPDERSVRAYDGFHLFRATPDRAEVWSWDGVDLVHRLLAPGDHVLVNEGVDTPSDPLVPAFLPLLAGTKDEADDWIGLLAGAGFDPADPRALIIRRSYEGREYGSTSASFVALGAAGVRYDFTANPGPSAVWSTVRAPGV